MTTIIKDSINGAVGLNPTGFGFNRIMKEANNGASGLKTLNVGGTVDGQNTKNYHQAIVYPMTAKEYEQWKKYRAALAYNCSFNKLYNAAGKNGGYNCVTYALEMLRGAGYSKSSLHKGAVGNTSVDKHIGAAPRFKFPNCGNLGNAIEKAGGLKNYLPSKPRKTSNNPVSPVGAGL